MKRETLFFTIVALFLVLAMFTLFMFVESADAGKLIKQRWAKYNNQTERLVSLKADPSKKFKERKGSIKGKITSQNGRPMEGCKVCFFDMKNGPVPGYEALWWRIPDFEYEGLVDHNGDFNALVAEGNYVLASVERLTKDEDFGPPLKGEKVFLSNRVSVKAGDNIDIGLGRSKVHKDSKKRNRARDGITAIEGIITDENGSPFKGGFVIAYPDGYLSKRTKKDGKFTLYLPHGGEFKLHARSEYGFA